ncbi:hypothetical protein R1sor_022360 [Riccia sorocarpa]|uniref:ATP synthase subunit gamma, mitochondrial n=1 Tax=Riccia sorocarpa TaxID=122646 RepID=A0ABD3GNV6_9MARC
MSTIVAVMVAIPACLAGTNKESLGDGVGGTNSVKRRGLRDRSLKRNLTGGVYNLDSEEAGKTTANFLLTPLRSPLTIARYGMASGSARRGGARLANLLHGYVNSSSSSSATSASWSQTGIAAGELAPFGARMASNQIVRNRMKSVKSIQKITKAMKMVAASKLRGVQGKTEDSRGLWQPFTALLGDAPGADAKKKIILTISSDKGLCGGINSTSVKFSKALMRLTAASGSDNQASYVVIGEKGKAQLQRDSRKHIKMFVTETQKLPINFSLASALADEIMKTVEFDAIHLVYNKFQSVVSFLPTVATILSPETLAAGSEVGKLGDLDSYEFEGAETKAAVLQNLSEFQFASVLYNAMLENSCSEMGARMSAMDNSAKNASDMLEKLTLSYNRSRQAQITTELIEIISGAAALEASS